MGSVDIQESLGEAGALGVVTTVLLSLLTGVSLVLVRKVKDDN